MDKKHLEIVKQNSYYYNNIKGINFNFECLIFDTESCTKFLNDNTSAKVYGWGLGCTRSKQMIYGETLSQFFTTLNNLLNTNASKLVSIKKVKKAYPKTKYVKVPIAAHNLGWDIEFIKYALMEQGYNYQPATLKEVKGKGSAYQTTTLKEEEKSFHIMQADNIVYGATVYMPFSYNHTNKDGSITKVGFILDFFDSYKIITCSVDNFPNYVHNVDEMFFKMKEQYDYSSYREDGHIQSDLELRYQYNDIYMLREVIEQFYIDNLCEGIMPTIGKRTASSIAFDKLKRMTFGEEKTNALYESYFEIDQTTKFESTRQRVENESYSGGFTHANKKYVTKHLKKEGCSLDINSSYPSQMAYKIFPHGKPKKGEYGKKPTVKENEVF